MPTNTNSINPKSNKWIALMYLKTHSHNENANGLTNCVIYKIITCENHEIKNRQNHFGNNNTVVIIIFHNPNVNPIILTEKKIYCTRRHKETRN